MHCLNLLSIRLPLKSTSAQKSQLHTFGPGAYPHWNTPEALPQESDVTSKIGLRHVTIQNVDEYIWFT